MNALTALGLAVLATGSPERVEDSKRGFSFVPPDGYEPTGAPSTFARGQVGAGSWAVFTINGLGGTLEEGSKIIPAIAEKAARAEAAKSGIELSSFEYRAMTWHDLPLELMVTRAAAAGQSAVTMAVQLPLEPEALQLQLIGPVSDEARLAEDLSALIGSVQGKSNWRTEAQRDRALGEKVGFIAGLAIVPVGAAIALFLFLRSRTRRSTVG